MQTTETPRRSSDRLYRLIAVVVVVIAAAVAVVVYRQGQDTPPAAASGAVDKQITITIANRQVSPPTNRFDITRGTTVQITVTSDVPDEVHVHGYNRKAELTPGIPASIRFLADTTGLFQVETHKSGLVLFQLAVR